MGSCTWMDEKTQSVLSKLDEDEENWLYKRLYELDNIEHSIKRLIETEEWRTKRAVIKVLQDCLHGFESTDGLYVSDQEDFSEQFQLDNSKLEKQIMDLLRELVDIQEVK